MTKSRREYAVLVVDHRLTDRDDYNLDDWPIKYEFWYAGTRHALGSAHLYAESEAAPYLLSEFGVDGWRLLGPPTVSSSYTFQFGPKFESNERLQRVPIHWQRKEFWLVRKLADQDSVGAYTPPKFKVTGHSSSLVEPLGREE